MAAAGEASVRGRLADDGATARRVRAFTVGAVALISISAFETLAVATVMPAVAADLGSLSLYALAFGAPLATSVVGMAVAGAWTDAGGQARPLLVGLALFCVGLVMAGVSPLMTLFVAGRAVQGLGAGALVVALYAMVGSLVPEDRRPRVFAWFAAAWVVPSMVGPAISGLMLHTVGWRGVFLLVPILAVLAVVVLLWSRRQPPAQEADDAGPANGGLDAGIVGRRVLLASGAGFGAAIVQVAGTRTQALWLVAVTVASVVMILCTVRLLPRGTFRLGRGLPSVIAVRGFIAAAFIGAEPFLPLYLVRERGWSAPMAGLLLIASAVTWAAGAWTQGRVRSFRLRVRLARLGTVLLTVGVAGSLVAVEPGVSPVVMVIAWTLAGSGMGLVHSAVSVLALELAPVEQHGEVSSALNTADALAAAVALAASGAVFAALLPSGVSSSSPVGSLPYVGGIAIPVLTAVAAGLGAWRFTPQKTLP
jgi:MFS family permease